MCTPGSAGFDADKPLYALEPFPKVIYVFEPMNTLVYAVPLKVIGNVNELGALHVSATCALPAVPVTLVGIEEALAIVEEDPTTTKVASTEASTRLSEKNLRKACRRWRFSRKNTSKLYLEQLFYVRVNPYICRKSDTKTTTLKLKL
jgi:hypothetical protein